MFCAARRSISGLLSQGVRSLRDFRSEGGAVAIWFAVLALPVAILAFGAIDLNRVGVERRHLQDALDAATLMAARSNSATDAEMQTIGGASLKAQLAGATDATLTNSSFKIVGSDVVGTAKASVVPVIANLWTSSDIIINAETTARRAQNSPVELVMVLDTTGSMAGTKLTSLKSAATSLINKLTVSGSGSVKIGVVPFGQYVNVGIANRNAAWISVPADYSTTSTQKGVCTTVSTKTTCQSETYACTKYTDGVPYASTCTRSINCVTKPITPVTTCTADKTTTATYKFSGCVGSPAYPKNVTDSDPNRVYPGFMNLTCASAITPLTNKVATVKAAITALTASGDTYIPSGLAWGFNMLSSPQPLTEAAAYDATGQNLKPRKAMVLMTDGANSKLMNASNGRHDVTPAPNPGSPATQANNYTSELCNNIKSNNIEIFTVAFNVTDNNIKSILKSCASDADHYFDATDTAGLMKSFQEIADALTNLYIAR